MSNNHESDDLKNNNKQTEISSFQVFKKIFVCYIWKIKYTRIILFPTLFLIIISKCLDVYQSEILQKIAETLEKDQGKSFAALLILLLFITIVSSILQEVPNLLFISRITNSYRLEAIDTFKKFFSLKYPNFYNNYKMGEINSTIERKSSAVYDIIDILVLNWLPTLFFVVYVLVKMFSKLGIYITLVIAVSLVIYTAATLVIAYHRRKIIKKYISNYNLCSNQIYDSFSNFELVKAYNSENEELRKYNIVQKTYEKSANIVWRSMYMLSAIQRLIIGLQTLFVLYIGIYGFITHKFTTGLLVFYLSVNAFLGTNLHKLGWLYVKMSQAMVNAKIRIIDIEEEERLMDIASFKQEITFKNVSIMRSNRIIVQNVNICIRKGEKIAIIGPNGIGKSTILKCLLKFVDYDGKIIIDGFDIKKINDDSLRNKISYIPQNSQLLNETVRYNLTYGNNNITEEEIINECMVFDIHNTIMRLEKGYDSDVGSNGNKLSGGEKQKISFVRAVLKKGDIFVLDEPTANIDKNSEKKLIKTILSTVDKNEKTIIMVAHTIELLKSFDRIFYIQQNESKCVTYDEAIGLMKQTNFEKK
ncbi:ABC transporter [Spraguea lophii 42_110]|uniref:ABC transporter n=1 Tax=Spraguea lophii (strain 42_110) TaxID=1358809 RepID=S7WCC6_SPRLO|nr:ABC transporter [Spraguea lophii 42_110]